ncbi:MAG TPA: hypothetical protein VGS17_09385 [Candidatus Limnocylindria bacterium]|nr:hypothetical protein [Candidatus Limnocylindria bacterium]
MKIRRRNVAILGVLTVAIVSLVVVGAVQGAQQRDLMERSFATLGRFPDAIAVNTQHEERRISESYVTPHSAEEIRLYYDERLHEMSWQGPGPDWTAGDFSMRCYVDPTGRLIAKLSTRVVPSAGSAAFGIEIGRNGCNPVNQ